MINTKEIWKDFISFIESPIAMYLRYKRLSMLGQVMLASKDTQAGHRIYLRCATLIENELNIDNPKNSEKAEGFYIDIKEDLKKRIENSSTLKRWIEESKLEIEKENDEKN